MENRYTRCHSSMLKTRQRAYYNGTISRKAECHASQCLQEKAKQETTCPSLVNTLGSFYVNTMKDTISSDVSLKEKKTFSLCHRDITKTNSESVANAVMSRLPEGCYKSPLKEQTD